VPADLSTTVAGVRLPFCVTNASGALPSTNDLRRLLASRTGALVLRTATVHPFVHPEFRSLQNPGFDKLAPLVRELVAAGEKPVIASIAGSTPDEYAFLARAFAEVGASIVEVNLIDPWVASTLAPFEEPAVLSEVMRAVVVASSAPVCVKLPQRIPLPHAYLGQELRRAGVRAVVLRNDFDSFEKFQLQAGGGIDLVVAGNINSGYDVSRAIGKGAAAVQVRSALLNEGPGIFARLEREMRRARGDLSS
jgi:dihydroorotate dehydrogenase